MTGEAEETTFILKIKALHCLAAMIWDSVSKKQSQLFLPSECKELRTDTCDWRISFFGFGRTEEADSIIYVSGVLWFFGVKEGGRERTHVKHLFLFFPRWSSLAKAYGV